MPSTDALKYAFKNRQVSIPEIGYAEVFEPYKGFNLGINFGTEHFFLNQYLGVRWGVGLGYTGLSQKTKESAGEMESTTTNDLGYLDVGASFDLMVNFWNNGENSVGIFGGIEADYHYTVLNKTEFGGETQNWLKDTQRNSFDLSGRVGLSMLFASHHRIDLTAKLPIGYVIAGNEQKLDLAPSPVKTSINVGYKYVF